MKSNAIEALRRHAIVFLIALGLAAVLGVQSTGCSDEGDTCSIDSDCSGNLWCDRRTGRCTSVECAGVECDTPELVDTGDSEPSTPDDTAEPDTAEPDTVEPDTSVDPDGSDSANPDDTTDVDDTDASDCVSYSTELLAACEAASATGTMRRWRVTSFLVNENGLEGSGFDIDADSSTCAPADRCEDGVDNAFAGAAGAVNLFFGPAVEDGDLRLGVELTDTGCGELLLLDLEEGDDWEVAAVSLEDGEPQTAIPTASNPASDDVFAGPGGRMKLPLILLNSRIEVPVISPRARGNTDGDSVVVTWGGVVRQTDLEEAILSIPIEDLAPLADHQAAIDLVSELVTQDLDLDCDGTNDAASLAFDTILEPWP